MSQITSAAATPNHQGSHGMDPETLFYLHAGHLGEDPEHAVIGMGNHQ